MLSRRNWVTEFSGYVLRRNLWLQRWDGEWNARVKGRLERRMQLMVCAGAITLHAARVAVQSDWHAAYRKYVAPDPSLVPRGTGLEEDEVVKEALGAVEYRRPHGPYVISVRDLLSEAGERAPRQRRVDVNGLGWTRATRGHHRLE